MAPTAPLEIKKDCIGEKFYASRNYNDLSHTYKCAGSNRTQLDWNMTLRQRRKNFGMKIGQESQSRSAPNLHETERKANRPPDEDLMHVDGVYHEGSETNGKYQNFASSVHMLHNLKRVSSGAAQTIDWQLNLRDGCHGKPDNSWRRHHTRSQPSFDVLAENCHPDNEDYRNSHITPQDRRIDRRVGALPTETIRDDPISFKRNPGCEGTQVGQWEHLIQHRRYGHKARRQLGYETTLREHKKDEEIGGSRISDTRSDGCIVEMLGKKKWTDGTSHDPMSLPPPHGDHKLYHLSRTRILPEPNEDNREMRMNKQKRTDADFSYKHMGKTRKKESDDT